MAAARQRSAVPAMASAAQANFCWFDILPLREEADVVRGLAEQGVLVRAGGALGKPGALRVSFGTREENARFIEVLGSLL